MPTAELADVALYYETFGDPSDPPVLLVSGLGMQLVAWGRDWFDRLVGEHLYVIAFDNRDVGLSTHFDAAGMPDILALFGDGHESHVAYHLADMADDAAGLLDHLGVASVHVVGISMGGMIAQELAIRHPAKVRSLCSIMSTTGAHGVGQPTETAIHQILRPAPRTSAEAADLAVELWKVIGSPGFPPEVERERRLAIESFERSHDPKGAARQLAAIISSPDRTGVLAGLRVPTVVLHGREDPLVQVSGGEATAAAIPGARLVLFDGMGHSMPQELWDRFVEEIVANIRLADAIPASKPPESPS
jgi:pimeloyl-ACP methyl ester carboxylesterase